MTTVADVTATPASGLIHIDALLQQGPGWNWVAPARNTLLYTFSLADPHAADIGSIYTGATSAFNTAQQAAAAQVLARVSQITGIGFQVTADGAAADIHFSNADLRGGTTTGFASTSWTYNYTSGNVITSYTADAWVYLDNAEFAVSNAAPSTGSTGFEVLLHEVGHALGLKHPFEGTVTLPADDDDTAHTLMSYTHDGGPHADYAPYDVAALRFLYGGDGLGGALGDGSAGDWLTGTAAAERLQGGPGDDRLDGGGSIDTAVYVRTRADYRVETGVGSIAVQALAGDEGIDQLSSIERLAFADGGLAFDLDGHAGTTARLLGLLFGPAFVRNEAAAGLGLRLLDGGMTPPALMQAALEIRLGSGFSHGALVDLLFDSLFGAPPDAAGRLFWVAQLQGGVFNDASLALAAASLDLNDQHIGLAGLLETGLGYGF